MAEAMAWGRKPLWAVASAACLAAALAVPTLAQADPGCTGYNFSGMRALTINQSDGWTVEIPVDADSFVGRAVASGPGSTFPLTGSPSGGINGKSIDFTVAWDNGHRSHYYGPVMGDGHGTGERDDVRSQGAGPDNTTWHTSNPLSCIREGSLQNQYPAPAVDEPEDFLIDAEVEG